MTFARIFASFGVAIALLGTGYVAGRGVKPAAGTVTARKILYYACPMHPGTHSDHPGEAPCCGMKMMPVYADESRHYAEMNAETAVGVVRVSDEARQLVGVRTDEVRMTSASNVVRLPGRVTADEARMFRLIAATDGWLRKLGDNPAGTMVKKDDVLAAYYANGLLGASQSMLYAVGTNEQSTTLGGYGGLQRGSGALNLQVAVDGLRTLGMTDRQIEELRASRQSADEIQIYSPVSGLVLSRGISPGQRFDKGMELYRIADLRHVWVDAQVFEKYADFVKPGMQAVFHYRGQEFTAHLSSSLPRFDAQTRSFRTRFEVDNKGLVLRPDMFVDLEIAATLPDAVTVPAEAVIDSGRQQRVYVERRAGVFEPRQVHTGRRLGDTVEVLEGLKPGERIVVSGNFLIDSESRIKSSGMPAEEHTGHDMTASVSMPVHE